MTKALRDGSIQILAEGPAEAFHVLANDLVRGGGDADGDGIDSRVEALQAALDEFLTA